MGGWMDEHYGCLFRDPLYLNGQIGDLSLVANTVRYLVNELLIHEPEGTAGL